MKYKIEYEIEAEDAAAAHEFAYTIIALAGRDVENVEVSRAIEAKKHGMRITLPESWVSGIVSNSGNVTTLNSQIGPPIVQ